MSEEHEPDEATAPDAPDRPVVDVRSALHVAGHETELLHAEDVPDTGPVLHPDEDDPDLRPGSHHHDVAEGFEGDIATRGM